MGNTTDSMKAGDRTAWFKDARFGMFLHWGPYAVHGRCVWASYRERMSHSQYAEYAKQFAAANFAPEEWAQMAKSAGMKYMVLCSRQHPGYSLWDSKHSDFTAAKGTPGRDLIAEYVEAVRAAGLKVGFYYSLLDWRWQEYFDGPKKDPAGWAKFLAYVHGQVRELCTNYGKIDIMWYDGFWPYTGEDWKADELAKMVRELQPQILINNRSGISGDFGTPEQAVRASSDAKPWESCFTMNDHWGYSPQDHNWKSTAQILHLLLNCVTQGGNLLLNIGPRPDGTFPPEAVDRLTQLADWYAKNGESVTGCGKNPLNDHAMGGIEDWILSKSGLSVAKGNTVYLHVLHWPGNEIYLGNIASPVARARMVADGSSVSYEQNDDRVRLYGLPQTAPDELDTVIALEFDEPPRPHPHHRPLPK